jgi:hypothetical protein
MSLIHYARPFLELGICKEYSMPRKTTETTTTARSKKTAASTQPTPVQTAPELAKPVAKEVPQNAKSTNVIVINHVQATLEDQIRRRAYELYLERRATAGSENGDQNNGDQNQDWLIAEREIRSRQSGQEHSA